MPYDKLLKQRQIKLYQASSREVEQLLQVAARDLTTAQKVLGEDLDWAFNIIYNAVLQAGRALMLHKGFRARGAEQHSTVVQFCEAALGPEHKSQIALFDQMRRKRHRLIYETVGLVSQQEVEQALAFARTFVGDPATGHRPAWLISAKGRHGRSAIDEDSAWKVEPSRLILPHAGAYFSQRLAASGTCCRGRSEMASCGQTARHTPHPKQRVGSMYTRDSAEE